MPKVGNDHTVTESMQAATKLQQFARASLLAELICQPAIDSENLTAVNDDIDFRICPAHCCYNTRFA